ncbi:Heterodisulfide reductase subunit C [Vulcanisaeta distributa DSM 14429]|uniref:Heterodisulfide reductase subunit C n=2 Tax=Vulcanisaeta distributa TaxID=164451 RepID=E1QNB5_VULDI|nr:Heterodisulfide reductase subunit C [Vulcanisaeta distributa DSM 14429]
MKMAVANPTLKEELLRFEPTASLCYQCGTCTTVCPMSEFGLNTRLVMKLANLGVINDWVRKVIWLCTGCGLCQENCPNEIRIPNVIRFIRSKVIIEQRRGR